MSSLYDVTEKGVQPNPLKPTPSTKTSKEYINMFKKDFQYKVISDDPNELVCLLSNIDVSIANAIRRILLADVPTLAIETGERTAGRNRCGGETSVEGGNVCEKRERLEGVRS